MKLSDYSGLGALAATLLLVVGFGIAGATGRVEFGTVVDSPRGLYVVDADLDGLGESGTFHDPALGGEVAVRRAGSALALGSGLLKEKERFARWKLAEVTNGLSDRTFDSSVGYLGHARPSHGPGRPSSGTFFNRGADGDFRGRVENVLNATADFGLVANQADEGMDLFDVKDITAGVTEFPADDQAAVESFLAIVENPWIRPYGEAALSTFSIDVDTAGYSIVRRSLLEQNRLPPPGALRVEELVNYFPYAYPGPVTADPFAVHVDAGACPWAPGHRLVRIALKGREIEEAVRPPANLVFLLDVSGSMAQPNKLPLVQKSIAMLTERLTARDRVAMVVYAGSSGLVLPSTPAGDHAPILEAIGRLQGGGSTNGGAGIELAYKVAAENFVPGGINRVVLATDGDFNVGVSDPSSLVKMVEEKAKSGVFLTALGYGMDNLKDSTLEQLADKGNGNYGYVDNLAEARKVLVEQGMSTLHCIAKDVKIQVEFNPARVAGYRLLGYENRVLAAQDFADDQKDAGEIGAGHTVTALYEVVPAGVEVPGGPVDELRFQRPGAYSGAAETLVVKLRWKEPEGSVSTPREFPFTDGGLSFESGSEDFRFAASVAAFGMVLRDSKCAGSANLDLVREIAAGALGADAGGYRAEFLTLVEKAKTLKR